MRRSPGPTRWREQPRAQHIDPSSPGPVAFAIRAIPYPVTRQTSAHIGITITKGGALNDPLGLTVAANGDILTVNSDDGYMVQTTPNGMQVSKNLLNSTGTPPGNGALFGLVTVGGSVYYVVDSSDTLNLFQ